MYAAVKLNLELAKAIGLPTENLQGFSITVNPGSFPVVNANFIVRTTDGIKAVSEAFELRPVVMNSHVVK
jgi:hypothetical protein